MSVNRPGARPLPQWSCDTAMELAFGVGEGIGNRPGSCIRQFGGQVAFGPVWGTSWKAAVN